MLGGMRLLLTLCMLCVGCAQVPDASPPREPIAPQLAARTGFLLEQLDARERELSDQREAYAALRAMLDAQRAESDQRARALEAAAVEAQALRSTIAERDETIRLRARQIVATFSDRSECTREIEALTLQLADRMVPGPVTVR